MSWYDITIGLFLRDLMWEIISLLILALVILWVIGRTRPPKGGDSVRLGLVLAVLVSGCAMMSGQAPVQYPQPTGTPIQITAEAATSATTQVEGELTVVAIEHFDRPGTDRFETTLETDLGTEYVVEGVTPDMAVSGDRVIIDGEVQAEAARFDGGPSRLRIRARTMIKVQPAPRPTLATPQMLRRDIPGVEELIANAPVYGIDKVLIIRLTFADTKHDECPPDGPCTGPELQQMVFGNPQPGALHPCDNPTFGTVLGSFCEQSHGLYGIVGDVVSAADGGAIKIPSTMAQIGNDHGRMRREALEQARIRGFNPDNYRRHWFYIYPTGSFRWAGLGTICGNPGFSIMTWRFLRYITEHESGHNFCLLHSHGCRNPGGRPDNCENDEYGHRQCIEGGGKGYFTCPQLIRMGWLGQSGTPLVRTVGQGNGAYTLTPLANPGLNGERCLKIVDNQGRDWFVEYRRDLGHDQPQTPMGPMDGISITYRRDSDNFVAAQRSDSTSTWDTIHREGDVFSYRGLQIRALDAGPNSIGVRIGSVPPSPGTPTPTSTPTITVTPTVTFTASPTPTVSPTLTPSPTPTRTPRPSIREASSCYRTQLGLCLDPPVKGEKILFHVGRRNPVTKKTKADGCAYYPWTVKPGIEPIICWEGDCVPAVICP